MTNETRKDVNFFRQPETFAKLILETEETTLQGRVRKVSLYEVVIILFL